MVLLTFGFWLLAIPFYPLRSSAQTTRPDMVDKPIHDAFEATKIISVSCEVEDGVVSADVCRFFTNALYVKLGKQITVQAFDDPGEDAARKGVLGAYGLTGKISFFMSQRLGSYVVLRLVEAGGPDATRLYVGGTAYDPSGPTIRQQSAIQGLQNLCASEGGTGPACDAVKQEESKVSQQPNHQLPVWSAKEGTGRDTGPTEAEKTVAARQLAEDFAAYWYKALAKFELQSGKPSEGPKQAPSPPEPAVPAPTQAPSPPQPPAPSSPTNTSTAPQVNSTAKGVPAPREVTTQQRNVDSIRDAAEQGSALAQYKLGLSFFFGAPGQPPDDANAYFWLSLAASGKIERVQQEDIVRYQHLATLHLTRAEQSQVQERVRKWLEDHPPKAP